LSAQSPTFPKPQELTAEPAIPPARRAAPPNSPYVANSPTIGAVSNVVPNAIAPVFPSFLYESKKALFPSKPNSSATYFALRAFVFAPLDHSPVSPENIN
jgi:hypothetical protein